MGWLSRCCCCCCCADGDDSASETSNSRRQITTTKVVTTIEKPIRVKTKPRGPRAYVNHNTARETPSPSVAPVRSTKSSIGGEMTALRGGWTRDLPPQDDTNGLSRKKSGRRKDKSSRPRAVASTDEIGPDPRPLQFHTATYASSSKTGFPPLVPTASPGSINTEPTMYRHPQNATTGVYGHNLNLYEGQRAEEQVAPRKSASSQRHAQRDSGKKSSSRNNKHSRTMHKDPQEFTLTDPSPKSIVKDTYRATNTGAAAPTGFYSNSGVNDIYRVNRNEAAAPTGYYPNPPVDDIYRVNRTEATGPTGFCPNAAVDDIYRVNRTEATAPAGYYHNPPVDDIYRVDRTEAAAPTEFYPSPLVDDIYRVDRAGAAVPTRFHPSPPVDDIYRVTETGAAASTGFYPNAAVDNYYRGTEIETNIPMGYSPRPTALDIRKATKVESPTPTGLHPRPGFIDIKHATRSEITTPTGPSFKTRSGDIWKPTETEASASTGYFPKPVAKDIRQATIGAATPTGFPSQAAAKDTRQATKVDTVGEGSLLGVKHDRANGKRGTTSKASAQQQSITSNTITMGIPASGQLPPRPTISDRSSHFQDDQWPASVEQSEIESDIHEDLTSFMDTMGLEDFFDNDYVRGICEKGAALARDPSNVLNTREDITDLTKLALYDTIIYCDDSNSMHLEGGKRIKALIEATKRVTKLATMLDPGGVKLRFINFHKDKGLDNIRTSGEIDKVMSMNKFRGQYSDLGTKLEKRILASSLYDQHQEGGLKRPLLITAITDGAPLKEDPKHFKNVILECKRFLAKEGYHPKSVVFQVSQVGDAKDADTFITELHQDPEIGGMVYCTSERLDDKVIELKDKKRDLDRWILDLLSQGIMLQA